MIGYVISIGLALVAFAGGWQVNGWRLQAHIFEIQKQISDANAEAAQNLNAANLLGIQLSDAQLKLEKMQHDKTVQIKERVRYVETIAPAKCDLSNVRVLINSAISNQDSKTDTASGIDAATK